MAFSSLLPHATLARAPAAERILTCHPVPAGLKTPGKPTVGAGRQPVTAAAAGANAGSAPSRRSPPEPPSQSDPRFHRRPSHVFVHAEKTPGNSGGLLHRDAAGFQVGG